MQPLEKFPWWPELIALKDVMSLRELAVKFCISPAAISNALKRNGITRTAAPAGPRSSRSEAHKAAAAAALQATVTKRGPPKGWVTVVVGGDKASPPPALTQETSAQDNGQKAFKVVFCELQLELNARDLVHAAEIAKRIGCEGVKDETLTLTVKSVEAL